jgi:catechol 2,3-dioxygenase-like lactoylglutathione lyase family enzyme
MSIRIHDLHHACLRVLDLDEATARWSVQFGLEVVAKEPGRSLLRCDSEDYCLELVQDAEADHDHSAWELAEDCSLDEAAKHLDACNVSYTREPDGSLRFADPSGSGLQLMPFRERSAIELWPDAGRRTAPPFGMHPRRLGHVNILAPNLAETTAFYTDVMGMHVSDKLGEAGVWLHVHPEHHQMAIVGMGPAHFHHIAFDIVDWGQLRVFLDHLGRHGRWLGWGPVHHNLARNLCAYVRIPEENLFVELYCDMEILRLPHTPREWADDAWGSNTWGVLPPRSYFRFDEAAVHSERHQLEAQGTPLPPLAN